MRRAFSFTVVLCAWLASLYLYRRAAAFRKYQVKRL